MNPENKLKFSIGKTPKTAVEVEQEMQDAKIAAQNYLGLSDKQRGIWRKSIWERLNIKGLNTSANAKADSKAINHEVGFEMTTWKPSKIVGAKDILIIKDLPQIEREYGDHKQDMNRKAA